MKAVALQPTSDSEPAGKRHRSELRVVPVSPLFTKPALALDGPALQRKSACACGGDCPRCAQPTHPKIIQPDLKVSSPGDEYEREADRVAEQVMRTSDRQNSAETNIAKHESKLPLQRVCSSRFALPDLGASEGEENLRAKAEPDQKGNGSHGVSAQINVPRHGGEPLPASVRNFFEPRFNQDFDHVRVHTDARAAESARAINARAYTVGHDVAFAAGQYQPDTPEGRRLLAHELTYSIQQRDVIARQADPDVAEREQPVAADAGVPDTMAEVTEGGIQDAGGGPAGGMPDDDRARGGAGDVRDAGTKVPAGVPDSDLPVSEPDKVSEPPPKEGKKVCFTYDDGPEKGTADVLNAHAGKIPATFFLTGSNMDSNPVTQKSLVERILKEGHQIGNHTFTHSPMTGAGYKEEYGDLSDPAKLKKFQDNFDRNEQHFRNLLGSTSPIFKLARLPGQGRFIKIGGKLVYVIATQGMGMAHVTWHFEFGTNHAFPHLKQDDWQGIKGVGSETNGLPGANAIILLHDKHWSGKQSLVEDILKTLAAKGYTFAQISSAGTCG